MAFNTDNSASSTRSLFKIEIPGWGEDAFNAATEAAGGFISSAWDTVTGFFGGGSEAETEQSKANNGIATMGGLLGPNGRAPLLTPGQPTIDVHQNFAWTASQADPARDNLPYVQIKEKVVNRSSRLQNLMYNTFALLQSPAGQAAGAAAGAYGAQKAASYLTRNKTYSGKAGIVAGAAGAIGGFFGTRAIANNDSFISGETHTNQLAPYSGLYSTVPTGFQYRLPFVKAQGNVSKDLNTSWQSDDQGFSNLARSVGEFSSAMGGKGGFLKGFGGGAQAAADMAEGLSQANEGLKYFFAGAFTEKAKSYQYGNNNNTFDINFYLFNNINWAKTVENWQLVFLLQYQNLPNRLNRLILTPPVIYEVTVPGYFYSMYSYIKNISVDFLGSNFLIDMPVEIIGNGGGESVGKASSGKKSSSSKTDFRVTVPEAYRVKISFENLLPETQNLLYEANRKSQIF